MRAKTAWLARDTADVERWLKSDGTFPLILLEKTLTYMRFRLLMNTPHSKLRLEHRGRAHV